MPEWSKGVDLRSTIFGCVGSNPTPDNNKFYVKNISGCPSGLRGLT